MSESTMERQDEAQKDPECIVRSDRCVVHGHSAGEAQAVAVEAAALKRRIVELEAALAASEARVAAATPPALNGSSNGSTNGSPIVAGAFAANTRPAVKPVAPVNGPTGVVPNGPNNPTNGVAANGTNGSKPDTTRIEVAELPRVPVADPSPTPAPAAHGDPPTKSVLGQSTSPDDFADGWGEGDATFEERIAAKAFFRDDAVEEPSRRWFLDKD